MPINNLFKSVWPGEKIDSLLGELQNLYYTNSQLKNVYMQKINDYPNVFIEIEAKYSGNIYVLHTLIPYNYPKRKLLFFEHTDFIEKIADRHVNNNGSLCLESPFNFDKFFTGRNFILTDYIELLVEFVNDDDYFIQNGHYSKKNYSHGLDGLLESIQDRLESNFTEEQLKIILFRIAFGPLNNMSSCICKSGIAICKCHPKILQSLKEIGSSNEFTFLASHFLRKEIEAVNMINLRRGRN